MSAVKRLGKADTGSAAVEFALVCPILVTLLFGIIVMGAFAATINGLEQLAAGAARTTVAGLSDAERVRLATDFITANAAAYPYISPAALTTAVANNAGAATCTVSLKYDVSAIAILQVARSLVPLLPASVTRTAVVPQGGL